MAKFIKIGKERIKISSIGGFRDCDKNPSSTKAHISLKESGKYRTVWFESEKEKNTTVEYLDKLLEVE